MSPNYFWLAVTVLMEHRPHCQRTYGEGSAEIGKGQPSYCTSPALTQV